MNQIEILHHNRDRKALIEKSFEINKERWFNFELEDIGKWLFKGLLIQQQLTPKDETKMNFKDIEQYLDFSKVSDKNYIYSLTDTQRSLNKHINFGCNEKDTAWLLNRGVTQEQIEKHNLISMSNFIDEKDRIVAGINIHPALQDWVHQEWPEGVVVPTYNLNGELIGCHNRFLSTVPKIKFGSSIPNLLLFTNLRYGKTYKRIFIVEGVFDALALETQIDKDDAYISPSTGYWEPEHWLLLCSYLNQFSSTIIPLFDNDRVGLKGNILLYKSFQERSKLFDYPDGPKDVSEMFFKYKMNISDFKDILINDLIIKYKNKEYKKEVTYEVYLDNRHASYSNDNYGWQNV